MLEISATCLVITSLLAYVNFRYIGLPITIGVMATSLGLSLLIVGLGFAGIDFGLQQQMEGMLKAIDFSNVLMQGMLSLLLFAGALHIDLSELKAYRWQVLGLAFFSTLLSTFIVGLAAYVALPLLGIQLPLIYCLLFGALISPTDPIAVMGILKSAGIPKNLELVIAGESLFNDGVGVVIFSILMGMLMMGKVPSFDEGLGLLTREAGGGLLYGLILGYITFRLLASVDNYQVEVMLTLAAVMGGYLLASKLHVSGPLAMVVAGLVVGNHGREFAMSHTTRQYVDMFWEMIDDILNAVLFVLIGMEVLMVAFSFNLILAALVMVAVTLIARGLTVWLPVKIAPAYFNLPRGAGVVLTWGGLRGGISVALALSLPQGPERDVVLTLTYGIVVFSILMQGLTIGQVASRAVRVDPAEPEAESSDTRAPG
ncbi:MAG: cation:proton antiporter [Burkholderiaceae bacterium]